MRFRLSPRPGASLIPLVLLLAWCAPPPEPPPPASPTAALDGTYTGLANGSCGTDQAASATLHSRRFTLSVGRERLEGIAAPNGSLSATGPVEGGGEVNFNGHIEGPVLRGGSYNGRCAYAFELVRATPDGRQR